MSRILDQDQSLVLLIGEGGLARSLEIPTAAVFEPLLTPIRYKAAWGGRGSGKSHFFAGLLIEDSVAERGLLSVCVREVQKSLKESAKRLIEQKMIDFRLGEADGFKVYEDKIKTPGDGIIIFQGMSDQTAESIKSLEGFKRCWWEEAQSASDRSVKLLDPTIRSKGSELWFSWNPRRKKDPIDEMFRGNNVPDDSIVVKSNWRDNPWFHETALEKVRLRCLNSFPDEYGHIWEGEYQAVTKGAYYAQQIATMKGEGRLGRVAADPLMTYRTWWDIGGSGAKADACAIWVGQFVGREIRVVDYYEAQGQPLAAHVAWLRSKGYGSALCILPHDGRTNDRVYDVSYESALRQAGFETQVIPNQGTGAAMARVEALRRLFPSLWINEATTRAGMESLGAYHAKIDEVRGIDLGPDHDFSSHAADAAGLMALSYELPRAGKPAPRSSAVGGGGKYAWMG